MRQYLQRTAGKQNYAQVTLLIWTDEMSSIAVKESAYQHRGSKRFQFSA